MNSITTPILLFRTFLPHSSSALSIFLSRSFSSASSSSSSSSSSIPAGHILMDGKLIKKSAFTGLHIGLLGAPGVGKGTYASRIGPYFSIPFISTGELVRSEIKNRTELGLTLKKINDSGSLVSDDIITNLLKNRLLSSDCKNGYLLDGYPRRLTQAKLLETISSFDIVLNIELREDLLIKKTMARRVCAKCGYNYNIADINENNGEYLMPPLLPKQENTCDKCHSNPLLLLQRDDDKESIVRHRLSLYHQETKPLEDYYSNKGILVTHAVKKGIQDMPELIQKLENFIKIKGIGKK